MAGGLLATIERVGRLVEKGFGLQTALREVAPTYALTDLEDVDMGDSVALAWRQAMTLVSRAGEALMELEFALADKLRQQEARRTRSGRMVDPAVSAAMSGVPSTGHMGQGGKAGVGEGQKLRQPDEGYEPSAGAGSRACETKGCR